MKYMPTDSPDEFEKQLGSLSLVSPSDDFSKLAINMAENKTALQIANKSRWLGYALTMTVSAVVVVGLGVALLNQEAPEIELVVDNQTSSSLGSGIPAPLYAAGIHYEELGESSVVSASTDADINVFFSYPCFPCFQFDSVLNQWASEAPSQIEVAYVPAIWSEEMRHYAQIFYAAENLAIPQSSHQLLYSAIHEDELLLMEMPILIRFFAMLGVSEQEFLDAYNSEETLNLVNEAERANREYRIRSVPSLVVDCQYYITINSAVEQADMLPIAEYLVTNQNPGNQTRC